jgi:hypothetical protein
VKGVDRKVVKIAIGEVVKGDLNGRHEDCEPIEKKGSLKKLPEKALKFPAFERETF